MATLSSSTILSMSPDDPGQRPAPARRDRPAGGPRSHSEATVAAHHPEVMPLAERAFLKGVRLALEAALNEHVAIEFNKLAELLG